MTTNRLWRTLDDFNLDEMRLEENGATYQTFGDHLLREKFIDRVISKNVYLSSAKSSCGITLLDSLVCGALAYSSKP